MPYPSTKVHQIHYTEIQKDDLTVVEMIAISTEDGRILFYSSNDFIKENTAHAKARSGPPSLRMRGELGGSKHGQVGRIKDFEILSLTKASSSYETTVVISGGSDGLIRLWRLNKALFDRDEHAKIEPGGIEGEQSEDLGSQVGTEARSMSGPIPTAGEVIGSYDTGSRITCLKAFVMLDMAKHGGGHSGSDNALQEEL